MTQAELELLWKHVEDARLQWKSAQQHATEVHADRFSGGIPVPDGSYAHLQAIHAQRLAVENFHRALQEFNAALVGEPNSPAAKKAQSDDDCITPREREVLALIAAGKSSKQIAAQLGMAFRTAVCHRYHLYQKLHVHTNVELTRAAMRMGLVDL